MVVGLELQGPSELIPKAAVFCLILLNLKMALQVAVPLLVDPAQTMPRLSLSELDFRQSLKMALQVAVPFLVDPSKVLPWLVRAEVDSRQSLMVPLQ
jgi:hypothetical protein